LVWALSKIFRLVDGEEVGRKDERISTNEMETLNVAALW
jgi:hypothetical protein